MIWPITLVQMRLLTHLEDVDFRVRLRARPFLHFLRCECLLSIEKLFMFAIPTSCTRVMPPSMPGPAAPRVPRLLKKLAAVLRRSAAPAFWQLQTGQALSLRVRRGSVLQLHTGAVWVTQRGVMPRRAWPETDSASTDSTDSTDSGDVFLRAGQCLPVSAGQHLVLESADTAQQGLVSGVLVRAVRQH